MFQLRFFRDHAAPDLTAVGDRPAPHTVSYVFEGSANVAGTELKQGQATYFNDHNVVRAGVQGAVIWRWELVDRSAPLTPLKGDGVTSQLLMARDVKMFELVPTSRWLFRLDTIVGFQGTTGVHSHPGSGIRCLVSGHLRAESEKGESSDNRQPGTVWYEEGAYPLVSTVDPGIKTTFLRGMVLPPEYFGFADSASWISGQPEGGPTIEGHETLADNIVSLV